MPALSGAKMDNLGSLLIETYKVSADAPALDDTDRALTYRQLSEAASAVERALVSVGLTPDEPVLVPVANEARDPAALLAVVLILLAVAGAACWAPARKASRIDPAVALRNE